VRKWELERQLVSEQNTNLEGENKSDFRAGVKVAESGIFGWLAVYYLG
jgi:hypothetical protein